MPNGCNFKAATLCCSTWRTGHFYKSKSSLLDLFASSTAGSESSDAEQWKQVDDCLLQPVSSHFAHSIYHFSVAHTFLISAPIFGSFQLKTAISKAEAPGYAESGKAGRLRLSSSMKVYPKFRNPSHYQNQINKPISNFSVFEYLRITLLKFWFQKERIQNPHASISLHYPPISHLARSLPVFRTIGIGDYKYISDSSFADIHAPLLVHRLLKYDSQSLHSS